MVWLDYILERDKPIPYLTSTYTPNYRLRPIAYLGEQTDFAKEVICGVDALKGTVGFVESNKPIPC